ncbi:glyoxalase family protein [Niveomyces insectorum RCEF 264]|uniref:Glyoxalase family protein n=1 Tax=Niveomyces insectorum RCEF 264 TaxID=1081102 RepID=A0A167MP87_9HYPO|nr:glyoxalase family protein [Niveomyces insectorum RCEF 264]
MRPTLDHIVVLVPQHELKALPSWLTTEFTVLNGGQHAGGATENKLILFQDGVYIELIAFVEGTGDHGSGRRSHRWGAQPEGRIIDWALGLAPLAPVNDPAQRERETDESFKAIQARVRGAGARIAYRDLAANGRTTPDGVVLKWAASLPAVIDGDGGVLGSNLTGGVLPFWCLDRTERKLRVPYQSDPAFAQHPSAAVGVAGINLHVADIELLERLRRVYDVLLAKKVESVWELAVPEWPPHGHPPLLTLVSLNGGTKDKATEGQDPVRGRIELSLFTTGEPRTVAGQFVDGWRIEIRLEKVQ